MSLLHANVGVLHGVVRLRNKDACKCLPGEVRLVGALIIYSERQSCFFRHPFYRPQAKCADVNKGQLKVFACVPLLSAPDQSVLKVNVGGVTCADF